MEMTAIREFVIELYVDERWQDFYRMLDRADAEGLWRRLLETQPRSRARLIEADVLRSFAGDPGSGNR
jgi:hypothetical protein